MASGVGTGIGEGIGSALGSIGDAVTRHKQANEADREKQADAYAQQAQQIGVNIAKYKVKPEDAANPNNIKFLDQTYSPDAAPYISQLSSTIQQYRSLFPPHETPAMIAHLQKMFGKTPSPAKPNSRADQLTAEGTMAQTPPQQNPILEKMQNLKQALKSANPNISDTDLGQQVQTALQNEYKATPDTPATPKPLKFNYHPTSGGIDSIEDPNTGASYGAWNIATAPPEVKQAFESIQKQQTDTAAAKKAAVKVSSEADFIKAEYGDNPTPAQKLEGHRLWTGQGADTSHTGTINILQPDNTIHTYEVTSTSHKDLPSLPGAPKTPGAATTPPKTPGEAKSRIKDLGVTGGHQTPEAVKAGKDYNDAVRVASLADQAGKSKNAASDKNFAMMLSKAGGGRGVQAYNILVKGYGTEAAAQQWLNGITTGALPDSVRQQLIGVAHDNVTAAKAAKDAAAPSTGEHSDDDIINALKTKP